MSAPLAVFDLDGTITRRDTLAPFLAGYLRSHPWRLPRLLLSLPTMLGYLVGRADRGALKGSLMHHVLGGLSRVEIAAWSEVFVPRLVHKGLFAEALAAMARHRADGAYLVLLSASPDLYVPLVGRALGFDEIISSRVLWRADGLLDGRLDGPNCRGNEKVRQLQGLLQRLQPSHTAAYGNSDADLLHMALVDEGIYVNGPGGGRLPPNIRRVAWSQRS
ncbi:MAG: HAD-IB family hydrolase [Steroidobacteraceae bacterium]